jgi:hypothetical protein
MKTLKQIMTEAHQIARTMEGNYTACLSEAMRISHKNSKDNFTPDFIKIENANLAESSIKEIYDIIYLGFHKSSKFDKNGEYSTFATEILEVVKNNSKGFQKDIAEKAYFGQELSSKQVWCVAYEFKNVS